MPSSELVLYTDGASRGNPGPAAIGVVVLAADGSLVDEISMTIGVETNNVAEYSAVLAGLERAQKLGATKIVLRADSELVVRQLNGQYRVKNANLRPMFERIKKLEAGFPDGVTYQHVRRELNTEADALANAALDGER